MTLAEICVAIMAVIGALFSLFVMGFIAAVFYFIWKWFRSWSKLPIFVWLRRRDAAHRARTGYWFNKGKR